ncbi:MAG: hypothetical protein M3228_10450 [Actinomycetota bacterium]|nr:hypothetical protein [Actinomycetota bacterium]
MRSLVLISTWARADARRGWGARDRLPAALRPSSREADPGAEFVVLPGEAHQPFQERPAEFNALIDAFWRKVQGLTS